MYCLLLAAVETGLFDHLEAPRRVDELSRELGLNLWTNIETAEFADPLLGKIGDALDSKIIITAKKEVKPVAAARGR